LLCGTRERELPLDAFYTGYQKNVLEPGELITSVLVPLRREGLIVRTYKISKRFDQDISAVCGAFAIQLDNGRVSRARVAFGGVAATVARAPRCEQALQGAVWNEATVRAAMQAIDGDYQPIGDMRASADYRKLVTRNLLYRCYLESTAQAPLPSVYAHGRASHG
jgi:xanthine dehydrogenase small subunit